MTSGWHGIDFYISCVMGHEQNIHTMAMTFRHICIEWILSIIVQLTGNMG